MTTKKGLLIKGHGILPFPKKVGEHICLMCMQQ